MARNKLWIYSFELYLIAYL